MNLHERRRFARVNLPMFYRLGAALGPRRAAPDVSLGGLRVYTDDALDPGTRLEVEIFLPAGDSLSVHVRVAWRRELPGSEDAHYEAGLEFLQMDALKRELLRQCLTEQEVG